MLGVNNRNLGTFHTDVNNSFKLVDKMRGFSPSFECPRAEYPRPIPYANCVRPVSVDS